jgi:hypothetical protein
MFSIAEALPVANTTVKLLKRSGIPESTFPIAVIATTSTADGAAVLNWKLQNYA